MEIVDNITPDQRSACLRIAKALRDAGGRALLVGGCVRDGLLGVGSKDIDMEVYGLSTERVESVLGKDFKLDAVGRAFGVFIVKGYGIDVALPRRESKTGPKHTDFRVEGDPTMSPEEAALRRDFTINAMSYDPLEGVLLDPCGGRRDLEARLLRHVSDAFGEDALRVLRGMQFVARFSLRADADTVAICRGLDPLNLPQERLWDEWKKFILKGVNLSGGLAFLQECGWLRFFPELAALVGCEQDAKWHPEGDVWTHTGHCLDAFAEERMGDDWEDLVVGLAVLCHDFGKPETSYRDETGRIRSPRHDVLGVPVAERFLERLTRQKAIFEEVLPLVEQHMRPLALYRDRSRDSAIRRLAARVHRLDRLVRVAYADKCGRPPEVVTNFPEGDWLLDRAKALAVQDNAPKPFLLGRHLIDLGAQPGKHFGELLDRCYEAQLDGAFTDEAGGLCFLEKLLRERSEAKN